MTVGGVSQKPATATPATPSTARANQAATPAGSFGSVLAKRRATPPTGALPLVAHHDEPRVGAAHRALTPAPLAQVAHGRDPLHVDPHHLDRSHRHGVHDREESPLDEHVRQAAQLAPPALAEVPMAQPVMTPSAEAQRSAALATILPQLVKQIAWSKESPRKGTVRMEFGAGALAGGSMLVQSDNGRVAVHLELPPGENHDEWRARVQAALARRGHHAADVDVT